MGARQTVERRQLGLSVKRHRIAHGRSQAEVGRAIGQSDSRISKVEDGTATLSPEQLEQVLDYLNVYGPERDTLLELSVRARKRRRRGAKESHAYTDTLPGSFQRIADMEADAVAVFFYEPGVIPGTLQSPGYIRAVMRACDGVFWPHSEIEMENRVAFRRERQIKVLEAAPPKQLEFVFTEGALEVGQDSTAVMREQLEHLLYLARQYRNITMQVLESSGLRNPAPNGGITVLDFGDTAPQVAFTPTVYGPSTYFDDERDAVALLRAFRRTQELARDHVGTIEVVRSKLREC